jgi:TusA-related sulfurtransferase
MGFGKRPRSINYLPKGLKKVPVKQRVNALGLICPAPLLMTRVALNNIAIGECIEVLCSDASSVNDFHRLTELTQHRMMTFEVVNKCLGISQNSADQDIAIQYRYVLKKGQ